MPFRRFAAFHLLPHINRSHSLYNFLSSSSRAFNSFVSLFSFAEFLATSGSSNLLLISSLAASFSSISFSIAAISRSFFCFALASSFCFFQSSTELFLSSSLSPISSVRDTRVRPYLVALLKIVVVIAEVLMHPVPLQLEDSCRRLVHEVSVMRYI